MMARNSGFYRGPNDYRTLETQAGYRFVDRDGHLELICNEITNQGLTAGEVVYRVWKHTNGQVNPHVRTIERWLDGKTKKPQHFLMCHIANALGLEWKLVPIPNWRTDDE